ncbi:hypothetical protein KCP77_14500 [Salmonella enterica subsp. enterica]|nr:hypothetical protein KCP77_14500 [Salmonella enterica subsp. enterica]
MGEKAAYVAGWMYFINWAMTRIVSITAVALYICTTGAHLATFRNGCSRRSAR